MTEHAQPRFSQSPIISIHLPKTGGNTVLKVLQERFGDGLFLDYPGMEGIELQEGCIEAIHGHFVLMKYMPYSHLVSHPRIMMFLREPLDRAISHYYYWLHYRDGSLQSDPSYKRFFMGNTPDLETFLLAPDFANTIYSYIYPLTYWDQFWFVGFQEFFNEDIARLQQMLGMRVTKQPILNMGILRPSIDIPATVKEEFYELNWQDKALYEYMLSQRNRSLQSDSVRLHMPERLEEGNPPNPESEDPKCAR